MKVQTFHSKLCKYLVITAQLFGYGGFKIGRGPCWVFFVYIHLTVYVYSLGAPKYILGL